MTTPDPTTDPALAPSILIVDDEAVIRNAFQIYFETMGYNVTATGRGEDALSRLRDQRGALDVVLLDLAMPGMQGLEVLRQMKAIDASVEVIIATGCGGMNTAIEAMRHGAFDYITKPVVNLDQDLRTVVEGALEHRARNTRGSAGTLAEPHALTTDSRVESYYIALESLAHEVERASTRGHALNQIAAFAERYYKALAIYEVDTPAGKTPQVTTSWGSLAVDLHPARAAWFPRSLEGVPGQPLQWQRLGLQATIGAATASPLDLEALSVCSRGEASNNGAAAAAPGALLLLRRAQGVRPAPASNSALWALVVERALAK